MTNSSSALPEGYRIRRLQLNNRDRFTLFVMPRDPRNILPALPDGLKVFIYKNRDILATAGKMNLYFFIGVIALLSLYLGSIAHGLGIGIVSLLIIVILVPLVREDWLQYCWVVEHQNTFVAFAILHPYRSYSELQNFYVHPEWQRRGIGSAFLRQLIQAAQIPIYANSATFAGGFYTRFRFQEIQVQELPDNVRKHFRFTRIGKLLVYRGGLE